MTKIEDFSIEINHGLKNIKDPFDGNVEVFVTLEDGLTVTVIVGTPKNFESLMTKILLNFFRTQNPTWSLGKQACLTVVQKSEKQSRMK